MVEEFNCRGEDISGSHQNKLVDEMGAGLRGERGTSEAALERGLMILEISWRSGTMLLAMLVTVRASSALS